MAAHRYTKWSLFDHTDEDGAVIGARIHDNADGTDYVVTVVGEEISSLTITPGSGDIDRRGLRAVPIEWLRDFAVAHVQEMAQFEPGTAVTIDLTHFENPEGRTVHPDEGEALRQFAEFYNATALRPITKDGRVTNRRDFLAVEPESPYSEKSYSWIDKRTKEAKDAGLIPVKKKGDRS